jgi:hypothetical protein
MASLSLARIMYGTSEDHYLPAPALPPLSNRSLSETVDDQAGKTGTLSTLLHRAWNNLSGKH